MDIWLKWLKKIKLCSVETPRFCRPFKKIQHKLKRNIQSQEEDETMLQQTVLKRKSEQPQFTTKTHFKENMNLSLTKRGWTHEKRNSPNNDFDKILRNMDKMSTFITKTKPLQKSVWRNHRIFTQRSVETGQTLFTLTFNST